MAKEAGFALTLSVDDQSGPSARNISNDATSIDWGTPRGVQEVTGLDKSAMERILLLADFTVNMQGVFNDAANLSHAVFKTISSTSTPRTITIVISGQTLANEALLTDYQLTRPETGELTWTVPGVLQDGTAPSWS